MRFDPFTSEKSLLALLAAIVMLAHFAIHAYLPALGIIAQDLAASEALVQYTIGSFLLGLAFGSLLAGPLSDAIGRRPVLISGFLGLAFFSLACALVTNAETFVVFRFFQALMGSASLLAGQALMADVYSGDELSQKQSIVMVAMVIAPMIAPLLGGWVSSGFGWRYIFWGLVLGGLIVATVIMLRLHETLSVERRNPMAISFMSGAFFVCVAFTLFLYIETYGMSVQAYAWLFTVGAFLAGLANFANFFVVKQIGYRSTLFWQGMLVIVCGIVLFCGASGLFGRWAIFGPGLLMMALLHVIGNNSLTGVMDQFDARKGTASAFAMSSRFAIGMIAVAIVGQFNGLVEVQYGLILFVFAVLAWITAQVAVCWDKSR